MDALRKGFGDVDRLLAGHSVQDQQRFVRFDRVVHPAEFVHQLVVDLQASGGVHYDPGGAELGSFSDPVTCNLYRRGAGPIHIYGHADLATEDIELVYGGRSSQVAGDEQGMLPGTFEAPGKLGGSRGLAGTV